MLQAKPLQGSRVWVLLCSNELSAYRGFLGLVDEVVGANPSCCRVEKLFIALCGRKSVRRRECGGSRLILVSWSEAMDTDCVAIHLVTD